jgi:hypothetical protein
MFRDYDAIYNKFRGLGVIFMRFIEFSFFLQRKNPWTGSTVGQWVARTPGMVHEH